MKRENEIIEYENALNKAMNKWFNSRPHIIRYSVSEFQFAGGFRMAWESQRKNVILSLKEAQMLLICVQDQIRADDFTGNHGNRLASSNNALVKAINKLKEQINEQ